MFSFVTMNWRGRPIESYRSIVELIGSTTTTRAFESRPPDLAAKRMRAVRLVSGQAPHVIARRWPAKVETPCNDFRTAVSRTVVLTWENITTCQEVWKGRRLPPSVGQNPKVLQSYAIGNMFMRVS
jgi:hypothetical protein